MQPQNAPYAKQLTSTIMSQQCTICQKTFELSQQTAQPYVIQIEGQYYCEECLEKLLLQEQEEIKSLEEKYIYYKEYESSFNTKEYCEEELKDNMVEGQDLEQVQKLEKQVTVYDELLAKAKQQCILLKQKVLLVEGQQDRFWDSINRFEKRSTKLQEKGLTAKLQLRTLKAQSQTLSRNSLYHQIFSITIQDNIGYISGLAMGKKPDSAQVNWEQFNVGLGHLFLGLNILSMKYGYCYAKIQQIQLKSHLTQVLLYGRQKKCYIGYSKQNQKNFSQVMQALLLQLYHFSYHILDVLDLEYNPQVKLPYPIKQKQFKIADIFISPSKILEKQKWAKWSQGVKYMLIDFKHLMTVHAIYGKD